MNTAVATRFLKALEQDENSAFHFQTADDSKNSSPKLTCTPYGTFEQVKKLITQLNDDGAFVSVFVNPTNGQGGRKGNITKIRALFVDLDGPHYQTVLDAGVPPHIITESSAGRYHCYWLVNHFPMKHFEDVCSALSNRFNGDLQCTRLNSALRLPGSINNKEGKNKFEVQIVEIRDLEDLPRYDVKQIMNDLNLKDYKVKKKKNSTTTTTTTASNSDPIPEGERDDTLFRIACACRQKGYSQEAALFELHRINEARCTPPVEPRIVEAKIKQAFSNYERGQLEPGDVRASQLPSLSPQEKFSDVGNAKRIAHWFKDVLKFNPGRGWCYYDGTKWTIHQEPQALACAIASAREIPKEQVLITETPDEPEKSEKQIKELKRFASRSMQFSCLNAAVATAKSLPEMQLHDDAFIESDDHINCANGYLELATGKLIPHNPMHRATRITNAAFQHSTNCPTWERFVSHCVGDNSAMYDYLQRVAGYCMAGDTSEQAFFFIYGEGSTGKSTFVETLAHVLGGYAMSASSKTFETKTYAGVPSDIARLERARLVHTSETSQGKRWDETLLKELTGGDTVVARFMRMDEFEFIPKLKLIIRGNHKPVIRETSSGLWRRMQMIPFDSIVVADQQDKNLISKLKAETDGILAWCFHGYQAFKVSDKGLAPPPQVTQAVEEYKAEADIFGSFLAESNFKEATGAKVLAKVIYAAFRSWCEETGIRPWSRRALSSELARRGFPSDRSGGMLYYSNLSETLDEDDMPF